MWISRAEPTYATPIRAGAYLRISIGMLLVLLLGAVLTASGQSGLEELARQGDSAYREGDFDAAIEHYERVISSGGAGGPLYFNLANAYYKSGQLARAILYYERALKEMPHNGDVRYNLELARAATVDRIEKPPRLLVWDWLDSLRDWLSPRLVALVSWALATLLALAILLRMLLSSPFWRRMLTQLARGFAVLTLLGFLLLGLRLLEDQQPPEAIVMVDKVEVYSAPDSGASEVFALHAGSKVEVVKGLEGWYEIRLADGRQGWLTRRDVEMI